MSNFLPIKTIFSRRVFKRIVFVLILLILIPLLLYVIQQTQINKLATKETYIFSNRQFQMKHEQAVSVVEERRMPTEALSEYAYLKKNNTTIATIMFFNSDNTHFASLDDFAKAKGLLPSGSPKPSYTTFSLSGGKAYRFNTDPYGNGGPVIAAKLNDTYILLINNHYPYFDQLISSIGVR